MLRNKWLILVLLSFVGLNLKTAEFTLNSELLDAIINNNADEVKKILNPIINPILLNNALNIKGNTFESNTLLHDAIQTDNPEIVKILLKKGADVNSVNNYGDTPLHLAAFRINPNPNIVKLLLDAGANYDAIENRLDRTALHFAASHGNTDTVKLLLDAGADPNIEDKNLTTPLHIAASDGNTDTIRALLEKGADINALDYIDNTVLHLAARSGNNKAAKFFLEKNLDINATNKFKETPLFLADNAETTRFFLDHGANPNITNEINRTPLQTQMYHLKHIDLPKNELLKIKDEYEKYQHTPEAQKLRDTLPNTLLGKTLEYLMEDPIDFKFSELPIALRQKMLTVYTPEYIKLFD